MTFVLMKRKTKIKFYSVILIFEPVNNCSRSCSCDFFTALKADGLSYSCKKKTKIIVHFCCCSDSRTGISRNCFLFNCNCRRNSLYEINIRFIHSFQKLPCIRRKTFDISSLSFSIDCIEDERRLSATTYTSKHNQLISRNLKAEIFQVVLACTFNDYSFIIYR